MFQCNLSSFSAGLKIWNSDKSDLEEIEDTQAVALSGITTIMAERVNVGSFGALSTEDPDANGYYVVE
jgi:hypothetical protein